MGTVNDPERVPRRGCVCALFATETDGTQSRTYARCPEHKRTARENRVGD